MELSCIQTEAGPAESMLYLGSATSVHNDLLEQVLSNYRVFRLEQAMPTPEQVVEFSGQLAAQIEQQRIKRLTVLGIADGSSVALALAAFNPKLVRRLILLNGTTRVSPGIGSRMIDTIERFLPLGLPLRPLSEDFDARPFLHRVRCPVLVLTTADASPFVQSQAKLLAKAIPNAWKEILTAAGQTAAEFSRVLSQFEELPAKRPQKNLTQ